MEEVMEAWQEPEVLGDVREWCFPDTAGQLHM